MNNIPPVGGPRGSQQPQGPQPDPKVVGIAEEVKALANTKLKSHEKYASLHYDMKNRKVAPHSDDLKGAATTPLNNLAKQFQNI